MANTQKILSNNVKRQYKKSPAIIQDGKMFSVQGLKEHTFRKPLLFFQQIK
jgi:hypothetical protein